MSEERPIVFTITQNDATHFRIHTKDNRADLQATVGYQGLFTMLASLSKTFNEQGYAVLFEIDLEMD